MQKVTEKDISFVIVTFKSNKQVYRCLHSLPKDSPKIIVENSNDTDFKSKLEIDFVNLDCYLMNQNLGYGAGNNFGIEKCKTKYAMILNPDVKFKENTTSEILDIININDFDIGAPINFEDKKLYKFNKKKMMDADYIKGFAIIVKKDFFLKYKFDENFFLYMEEIDLCKRIKIDKKKLFLLNVAVDHIGGLSHGERDNFEMEKSRNWHWMWSNFYYYKKYNGYLFAFFKTFPNFINCLLKYFIFSIFRKEQKKTKYKMRFLGLLNSYLLNKSFYRPYDFS